MGYEVTLFVVEKGHPTREPVLSDIPYSDGSGFEPKKDKDGKTIYTGRQAFYCQVIGVVDLCKLGSGHVASLDTYTDADREKNKTEFCYFFAPAGNGDRRVEVDRYDTPVRERDIHAVLEALILDHHANPYRRFPPAIALLQGVVEGWKGNTKNLRVLFYAH